MYPRPLVFSLLFLSTTVLSWSQSGHNTSAENLLDFSQKGIQQKHLEAAQKSYEIAQPYDSIWYAALERVAIIYYLGESLEKFHSESRNYLQSSIKQKHETNIGKGNYLVGSYFFAKSEYDSAYYYFYRAQKAYKKVHDSIGIVENILSMAIISKNFHDYYTSEALSIEALNYLPNNGGRALRTSLYNNLGIIFSELGDYNRSKKWYVKSLELAKEPKEVLTLRNNIGVVHRKQGGYTEALKMFTHALDVDNVDSIPLYKAMVIDNIGYAEFLQNGSGLEQLQAGLTLRERHENKRGIIASSLHLGEYYMHNGKSNIALEYLTKALTLSHDIGNTKNELKALKLLARGDKNSKYLRAYTNLQDSILQHERSLRHTFASIRFETMEAEMKSLKLEKKNSKVRLSLESERRRNAYLWIAVIGLAFLFVLGYVFVRSRKRRIEFESRIKELRTRIEEQDRISSHLHHDIANDLLHSIEQFDKRNLEIEDEELGRIIDFLESVYTNTVRVSHELGTARFKKIPFERSVHMLLLQVQKPADFTLNQEGT